MYSRSSVAWPAPETTFARLCSRVMSCGVGCTKTRTFTTVLHLYKLKAQSLYLIFFLGVKRNSNATSEYLGFLPLLLQYCSWQSFVKQFQNAVYNLQTFKTYHAFTFVKRTLKAELLIYSIVHESIHFFFAPARPDFHSCDHVHAAALPQHVVNTGHIRTPKIPFQRPKNADLLLRRVLLSGRPVFDSRRRMHPIKCN